MKIAWLIKRYDDSVWEIVFTEPERYYHEIKMIAYVEVAEGEP